jgi:hypothetical protein
MWQAGPTVEQGDQTQIQEIPHLKYKLPISFSCVFSTENKQELGYHSSPSTCFISKII